MNTQEMYELKKKSDKFITYSGVIRSYLRILSEDCIDRRYNQGM